jgi:acyl dehydratase
MPRCSELYPRHKHHQISVGFKPLRYAFHPIPSFFRSLFSRAETALARWAETELPSSSQSLIMKGVVEAAGVEPASEHVTFIGGSMQEEMYFEDFYPGQKFNSLRTYRVTASEIISFGKSYDPQPFHIDEGAGENSFFSGLCASGWLTAAIVMRLRVESINVKGGMIGAGVDEIRWTHPVRPEDKLRTESEVLDVRRSVNRPGFGIVRSRTTVFNQRNETVMKSIVNWLAPLKNA